MAARRLLLMGAASVLGQATVRLLAGEGHELWLTHCNPGKRPFLESLCPGARVTRVDVTDPDAVSGLFRLIGEQWGGLDGVVCAFGVGLLKPLGRCASGEISAVMKVNVEGAILVCRDAFPLLLKGQDPAVVLFSSTMGLVGGSGMAVYAASKAAVAHLARNLAVEWAPRRIRVNAVAPGVVPSPLVEAMFARLSSEQVQAIQHRHPLGFGQPSEVAGVVRFLLSSDARWITGAVLPVDGGYTAQ